MAATVETLHKEIQHIKNDICLLKHIMQEDYVLSDETKKELNIARKTPRSEYVPHETVKKILLK